MPPPKRSWQYQVCHPHVMAFVTVTPGLSTRAEINTTTCGTPVILFTESQIYVVAIINAL